MLILEYVHFNSLQGINKSNNRHSHRNRTLCDKMYLPSRLECMALASRMVLEEATVILAEVYIHICLQLAPYLS